MAEIKKYLDSAALSTLVTKIKSEDDAHLEEAKQYANGLAKNYDAAGAATTAESNAKAYTDALASGQVATNKADIAKLNGDVSTEGSVAKAVADSASTLQESINAVDAIADKNAEDIAAINNAESGILAQAKADATEKANAVQEVVDALAGKVGEVPADQTVMGIIANIQENAYDDTELRGLISGLDTNKADKTQVATDIASAKTELEGKITTAQSTAEGAQSTANTAKAAIDAFLLEADATEKAVDTLKEIQAELAEGEASAASMLAEINALKAVDNATQEELDAALVTVNENIDKKADKTTVEGIEGRVADLEAIDFATKAYADQSETDAVNTAKEYTDGIDTALKARLDALELVDHDHANKAEIDLIASGDVAKWNDAVAKAHEHGNKTVIDGITTEKVAAWDAAEGNAKTYADGLNAAMTTKVDGVDARVKTLEETIVDKADADDLAEAVADISENAAAIAANTSAINSFTPITSSEVEALFA